MFSSIQHTKFRYNRLKTHIDMNENKKVCQYPPQSDHQRTDNQLKSGVRKIKKIQQLNFLI